MLPSNFCRQVLSFTIQKRVLNWLAIFNLVPRVWVVQWTLVGGGNARLTPCCCNPSVKPPALAVPILIITSEETMPMGGVCNDEKIKLHRFQALFLALWVVLLSWVWMLLMMEEAHSESIRTVMASDPLIVLMGGFWTFGFISFSGSVAPS